MGERGHTCNPRSGDVFETLQLSGRLARSIGLEEADLGIAYFCPGVLRCDVTPSSSVAVIPLAAIGMQLIACLCVAIKLVVYWSLWHQMAVAGGSRKWLAINRSTLVNHLESHCCLVTVVVVPMWCCWVPTNGWNGLIVAAWPVAGCGS